MHLFYGRFKAVNQAELERYTIDDGSVSCFLAHIVCVILYNNGGVTS